MQLEPNTLTQENLPKGIMIVKVGQLQADIYFQTHISSDKTNDVIVNSLTWIAAKTYGSIHFFVSIRDWY